MMQRPGYEVPRPVTLALRHHAVRDRLEESRRPLAEARPGRPPDLDDDEPPFEVGEEDAGRERTVPEDARPEDQVLRTGRTGPGSGLPHPVHADPFFLLHAGVAPAQRLREQFLEF